MINRVNIMNLFKQKPTAVYVSAGLALLVGSTALISFSSLAADEVKAALGVPFDLTSSAASELNEISAVPPISRASPADT